MYLCCYVVKLIYLKICHKLLRWHRFASWFLEAFVALAR